MSVSNKLRISYLLLFLIVCGSMIIFNYFSHYKGLLVMVIMIDIITFMVFNVYTSNLKCKCGKYIFEVFGDDLKRKPFTYFLFNDTCENCKDKF